MKGLTKTISSVDYTRLSYISVLIAVYGRERCKPIPSTILQINSIDEDGLWINLIIMIVSLILFRFIALIALIFNVNYNSFKIRDLLYFSRKSSE